MGSSHGVAMGPRDTYKLKVRRWKKIFHANGNQKKFRVAFLISDEIDFKINNIARDKGHYITTEASIKEEGITIVNICVPNIRAPQYIRKKVNEDKTSSKKQKKEKNNPIKLFSST